jgi:hypothetical protein
MTSSWRIATLLAGVSIASAAGLFGMVLIDISELQQVRNSSEHERKNSYGTGVSDKANHEIPAHSENILSSAEENLRSDTLLWVGLVMVGFAIGSALCLLLSAFLDDVWHIEPERSPLNQIPLPTSCGRPPIVQS